MKFLLGLHFIPLDADLGLLLRRVALAGLMIVFHGWEKLMTARRHKRRFTGPNAGEMAFAYMFGYLLLFFAGARRYSLDRLLGI
jgi:uncharacterized membrane protein YphA (DoxX/SURF4 family)